MFLPIRTDQAAQPPQAARDGAGSLTSTIRYRRPARAIQRQLEPLRTKVNCKCMFVPALAHLSYTILHVTEELTYVNQYNIFTPPPGVGRGCPGPGRKQLRAGASRQITTSRWAGRVRPLRGEGSGWGATDTLAACSVKCGVNPT